MRAKVNYGDATSSNNASFNQSSIKSNQVNYGGSMSMGRVGVGSGNSNNSAGVSQLLGNQNNSRSNLREGSRQKSRQEEEKKSYLYNNPNSSTMPRVGIAGGSLKQSVYDRTNLGGSTASSNYSYQSSYIQPSYNLSNSIQSIQRQPQQSLIGMSTQPQLKEPLSQAQFKINPTTSTNSYTQSQANRNYGDYYGRTREFEKPDDENEQLYSKSYGQKSSLGTGLNEKASLSSLNNQSASTTSSLSKKSGPPPGLRNIGNTCFLNSILQCIFASPYLNDYFLGQYQKGSGVGKARLADAYHSLIKQVKQGHETTISPTDLKYAVSKVAPQFSGYGQQDAQEFLRFLLDGLHEELNRVRKKPAYKEMDFDKLPADQQSEKWWQYNKERDDSIITDLFTGQLMNKIECQSCGYCSNAFDNFQDLSVSIPRSGVRITGYKSLDECLESFIKAESMETCGYKCSKCKKVDNFKKEMTLYRFPKIMVIHLKRFYNSSMRREKVNTTITIPQKIDLSSYAPHSNHESKKKAKYQLYGISHHSGTLYGGHYIGEAFNFDDGKWYQCNDSWVKACSPDLESASAYVLFYVQL